jgi:nucleoside-diphosphate-sugar epimerase
MERRGDRWSTSEDICRAIILALEAPREAVHNEIFNVGDDQQNYRIR